LIEFFDGYGSEKDFVFDVDEPCFMVTEMVILVKDGCGFDVLIADALLAQFDHSGPTIDLVKESGLQCDVHKV
jgi:hypothetical protein